MALQYTRYENATVENELKISKPHTHTEVFTPSKSTQTLIFHLRAIKPTGKILKNITRAFQLVSVSLSDMKHHNNCPVTQNPIFYCAQRKYRIHKDNTHMLHLREQSGKRTHSKAVRERFCLRFCGVGSHCVGSDIAVTPFHLINMVRSG